MGFILNMQFSHYFVNWWVNDLPCVIHLIKMRICGHCQNVPFLSNFIKGDNSLSLDLENCMVIKCGDKSHRHNKGRNLRFGWYSKWCVKLYEIYVFVIKYMNVPFYQLEHYLTSIIINFLDGNYTEFRIPLHVSTNEKAVNRLTYWV